MSQARPRPVAVAITAPFHPTPRGNSCVAVHNALPDARLWRADFAGYIYQNFITAVIFVAFTNPYNVGDRVRIDNGEAMYVRNIHTYTTEFVTVHAKPVSKVVLRCMHAAPGPSV